MPTVSIVPVINGNRIAVKSPYHPEFIALARQLGGKWSGTDGAWLLDERDRERIEDALRRIFGTAGEPTATADVRVNMDRVDYPGGAFYALGRLIVERKARDSRARVGDGVAILEGGFPPSGGSMKYPRPAEQAGTVLEVRDVPLPLAMASVGERPTWYQIVATRPIPEPEPAAVEPPEPEPAAIAAPELAEADGPATLADVRRVQVARVIDAVDRISDEQLAELAAAVAAEVRRRKPRSTRKASPPLSSTAGDVVDHRKPKAAKTEGTADA